VASPPQSLLRIGDKKREAAQVCNASAFSRRSWGEHLGAREAQMRECFIASEVVDDRRRLIRLLQFVGNRYISGTNCSGKPLSVIDASEPCITVGCRKCFIEEY
jgi:hypothetical protein